MYKGNKVVLTSDIEHSVTFGGSKRSVIKAGTAGVIRAVQVGTGYVLVKFAGHANLKHISDLSIIRVV